MVECDRSRDKATRLRLEVLRVATDTRHKLRLTYLDAQQRPSQRTVHPFGCFFWGQVWTLAAWRETREAFRSSRVYRIQHADLLGERYRAEPGQTLADLLIQVGSDEVRMARTLTSRIAEFGKRRLNLANNRWPVTCN